MSASSDNRLPLADCESSDQSLVRRFSSGENEAATILYNRYATRLLQLADNQLPHDLHSRFDAEDVVQSVFQTFFRRAKLGSYQVPPGEELWKLLLVITLNKVRTLASFHRADKRNVRATAGNLPSEIPGKQSQASSQASQLLKLVVDDWLASLPDPNRTIVTLRIEGYQVAEIAEKTKRSKRTIERILQSVRQELHAAIQ